MENFPLAAGLLLVFHTPYTCFIYERNGISSLLKILVNSISGTRPCFKCKYEFIPYDTGIKDTIEEGNMVVIFDFLIHKNFIILSCFYFVLLVRTNKNSEFTFLIDVITALSGIFVISSENFVDLFMK